MDVFSETLTNEFECRLRETLRRSNLEGCALVGLLFPKGDTNGNREIDALVLMEPGVFVCLEAKNWSGKWEGGLNEAWRANGQKIPSVRTNPHKQVRDYSFIIKNKLEKDLFSRNTICVHHCVVAPDDAEIAVENAVINEVGEEVSSVHICNLSQLEQVLTKIRVRNGPTRTVVEKVREFGGLRVIGSRLAGMSSVEGLDDLAVNQRSGERRPMPRLRDRPARPTAPEPEVNPTAPEATQVVSSESGAESKTKTTGPELTRLPSQEPKNNQTNPAPIPVQPRSLASETRPRTNRPARASRALAVGLLCAVGVFAATATTAAFFWGNRPCEISTETRISGICYKDLARAPLRVGILTSPDQYMDFKSYLEKQLGSRALSVVIEGDADTTYLEAQNQIAKQEWDVVFTLSPMNGMRAKDNGYTWAARMFPDFPPVYQAALYVRADSSIQSINDITPSTVIALGDFSSASSFYMPTYDLYGKSASVTVGHRSRKIKELVASGQAAVGTAVYSSIKDNPSFRVIQVSREIPSSGVYLSPKLSPADQEQVAQLLMAAPEAIKKQANYGMGDEPDYEVFRAISVRADEVMACANFNRNPVQFFCDGSRQGTETYQGIVGKVSGFTNQADGMVRLRLERQGNQICTVLVSLKTLSRVANGTSPGVLNGKQVNIVGVEPETSAGNACELKITAPDQLIVLQGDGKMSTAE